jgi:hypothetical protein
LSTLNSLGTTDFPVLRNADRAKDWEVRFTDHLPQYLARNKHLQLATDNRQLATGNWQLATGNWQLATGN